MAQKKNYHKEFLAVAAKISHEAALTKTQVRIIRAEAKWVRSYIADKQKASAARTSFGRPPLPDEEVSEATLKKRAYRSRKASGII